MITIDNASFKINDNYILKNISFNFNPGEIVGIIGPENSGKTSLINLLSKKLKPTNGSLSFSGKNYNQISKSELFKMFSNYPLVNKPNNDDLLINFLTSARLSSKSFFSPLNDNDKQLINSLIKIFELSERLKDPLYTLSDSTLQKAYIAYCYIKNPEVILLDNPSSFLDLYTITLLKKSLKKFVMNGDKIAIISSQDLNLISQIADKIIIMYQGTIILEGNNNIITAENIKRYFNVEAFVSKNVYTGKSEINYFSNE